MARVGSQRHRKKKMYIYGKKEGDLSFTNYNNERNDCIKNDKCIQPTMIEEMFQSHIYWTVRRCDS